LKKGKVEEWSLTKSASKEKKLIYPKEKETLLKEKKENGGAGIAPAFLLERKRPRYARERERGSGTPRKKKRKGHQGGLIRSLEKKESFSFRHWR